MTRFRPCIDLHEGRVKQLVGGTFRSPSRVVDSSSPPFPNEESKLPSNAQEGTLLSTGSAAAVTSSLLDPSIEQTTAVVNFSSQYPASYYAKLYKQHHLLGAHVIQLGQHPLNKQACIEALEAWPHHLQVGGGISLDNAHWWLHEAHAAKVIVTSFYFPHGRLSMDRVQALADRVGADKIVVDLSCRRTKTLEGTEGWCVAMQQWQTLTDTWVTSETLNQLKPYCSEFLIHAADVEGKCQGMDLELIHYLATECLQDGFPCTYAGGASSLNDLQVVKEASQGRVDLTIGSALDLFGGTGVSFEACVQWNREQE